jgi:2-methylcitrate dehydratase PrpD
MGLTQKLAELAVSLRYEDLPREAVETAKRGMIDCVGVFFAGRGEPVVRLLLDSVDPGTEAALLFGERKARSADAALVNGAAAHALDYDDVALDGHPSVVLVPTILAEGERLAAPGKELIAAYVAGYETWAELVTRDADKHHGKGWHPTAVFGAVGAAAAASRLARLTADRAVHAVAMAASMAGGIAANFGSMTKPFQAGRAAQSGILAARLAAAGMTASLDALEHPGGFLAAISPKGRVRLDDEVGRMHILRHGLHVKRYPVCYALHRSIDAVLERTIAAEDVESVEVHIGKVTAGMLRYSSPQNGLDAKFSAQFAIACALLRRRVGLADLTDEFVRSAPVQALMRRVRVVTTDETDPDEPIFAPYDFVTLRLKSGEMLKTREVRHALGNARNPIGLEELRAKFDECTGGAQGALFERLLRLEELEGGKLGSEPDLSASAFPALPVGGCSRRVAPTAGEPTSRLYTSPWV